MKKVMVVAGGIGQVPLIKKLKAEGYYVVNSNLYEDSVGFRYADKGYVVDVRDKDGNLKIAEEECIDAIITDQSDIAVPTVSYVAYKRKLTGIPQQVAALFTDKFLMREFCKKNNFYYPEYRLCTDYEQAAEFLDKYRNIIIKPIDSQASRDVYRITEHKDLKEKFFRTCNQSWKKKVVLAERYIEGTEFTVDSLVIRGKCIPLATSIKYQYAYNPNVTQVLYFTNESEEYDLEMLKTINVNLVEKMKLPFGITHAEYKQEKGKFYLIEVAARGGGTKISSDIVPLMSGVDNYNILIRMALGENVSDLVIPDRKFKHRKAVLEFWDLPEGCVKAVKGLDKIRQMKNVVDAQINFGAGSVIESVKNDTSRAGYFIAYGESEYELEEVRNNVRNALEVEYEK